MDSVVDLFVEASAEEAVLSPEVDIFNQIKTSTEGVVKDLLLFSLQGISSPLEEQSDLVAEEAFSFLTAVEWGTWRKITVLPDNNNSDLEDFSAVDVQGTASVP